MTRTFTIIDTPNVNMFHRYTVKQDTGRPYEDNPPVVTTNETVDLFASFSSWLLEGNQREAEIDRDGIREKIEKHNRAVVEMVEKAMYHD